MNLWEDRVFRITIRVAAVTIAATVIITGLSIHTVGAIPALGFLALWNAKPEPSLQDELDTFLMALR